MRFFKDVEKCSVEIAGPPKVDIIVAPPRYELRAIAPYEPR